MEEEYGCFTEHEVEEAFKMIQCAADHSAKDTRGHVGAGHFCHAMANFGIPGFEVSEGQHESAADTKVAELIGITDRHRPSTRRAAERLGSRCKCLQGGVHTRELRVDARAAEEGIPQLVSIPHPHRRCSSGGN